MYFILNRSFLAIGNAPLYINQLIIYWSSNIRAGRRSHLGQSCSPESLGQLGRNLETSPPRAVIQQLKISKTQRLSVYGNNAGVLFSLYWLQLYRLLLWSWKPWWWKSEESNIFQRTWLEPQLCFRPQCVKWRWQQSHFSSQGFGKKCVSSCLQNFQQQCLQVCWFGRNQTPRQCLGFTSYKVRSLRKRKLCLFRAVLGICIHNKEKTNISWLLIDWASPVPCTGRILWHCHEIND